MKIVRKPGNGAVQLKKMLNGLNDNKVGKVGWFESAKYPDGTPVAYVAAIQEYGDPAKNIPSRSFMRTTIAEKQNTWRATAKKEAKRIAKGEITSAEALDVLGMQAAGHIQKKIAQIQTPPLKESTILARARRRNLSDKKMSKLRAYLAEGRTGKNPVAVSTKPLVDTRYLVNTITNTLDDKGKK